MILKKFLFLNAFLFILGYSSFVYAINPGAATVQMRNNAEVMQQNKQVIRAQQQRQNVYYPKVQRTKKRVYQQTH